MDAAGPPKGHGKGIVETDVAISYERTVPPARLPDVLQLLRQPSHAAFRALPRVAFAKHRMAFAAFRPRPAEATQKPRVTIAKHKTVARH